MHDGSENEPEREPWRLQPNEPKRMHRVFEFYLRTRPRSLREAVRLAGGDDARKPVSIPGHVSKCSQRWQWQARADAYDAHVSAREAAEFDAVCLARKQRRLAQIDRISGAFDQHLAKLGPRHLKRLSPRDLVQAVVRLHEAERQELGEDTARERRPIGSLPSLEDVIKPPEE